jgi:hypothetical protein
MVIPTPHLCRRSWHENLISPTVRNRPQRGRAFAFPSIELIGITHPIVQRTVKLPPGRSGNGVLPRTSA